MASYITTLFCHSWLVHARDLQLPESFVERGQQYTLRFTHKSKGQGAFRGRRILCFQYALDMGRDEPAAWKDQYPFQGEGDKATWYYEVSE